MALWICFERCRQRWSRVSHHSRGIGSEFTRQKVAQEKMGVKRFDKRSYVCDLENVNSVKQTNVEKITVRELRSWLAALPPEFQEAPIEGLVGQMPCGLKRIVAYRYKDGS